MVTSKNKQRNKQVQREKRVTQTYRESERDKGRSNKQKSFTETEGQKERVERQKNLLCCGVIYPVAFSLNPCNFFHFCFRRQ